MRSSHSVEGLAPRESHRSPPHLMLWITIDLTHLLLFEMPCNVTLRFVGADLEGQSSMRWDILLLWINYRF